MKCAAAILADIREAEWNSEIDIVREFNNNIAVHSHLFRYEVRSYYTGADKRNFFDLNLTFSGPMVDNEAASQNALRAASLPKQNKRLLHCECPGDKSVPKIAFRDDKKTAKHLTQQTK